MWRGPGERYSHDPHVQSARLAHRHAKLRAYHAERDRIYVALTESGLSQRSAVEVLERELGHDAPRTTMQRASQRLAAGPTPIPHHERACSANPASSCYGRAYMPPGEFAALSATQRRLWRESCRVRQAQRAEERGPLPMIFDGVDHRADDWSPCSSHDWGALPAGQPCPYCGMEPP